MKPECLAAVAKAAGRNITQAEAQSIEDKLAAAMRRLAARDRHAFAALTPEQRLAAAAHEVAAALRGENELAQYRFEQNVKASARIATYVREQKARGMDPVESLQRFLVNKPDGRSHVISVESWGNGIKADALRRVTEAFEAVDPRFFGFIENAEGVRTFTHELFGQDTGNAVAKRAAEAFHTVANELRQRFNAAGGRIPEREDWAIPHHHSQSKVAKAGFDAWSKMVFPLLNRRRYFDEGGRMLNDGQMVEFLREAYDAIATGGVNKAVPGGRSRMKANEGDQSREVHFKDADSYLKYQEQFGDKRLLGVIAHHLEGLSRNIAAIERLGPNPEHTYSVWRDRAVQEIAKDDPRLTGKARGAAAKMDGYYDWISGRRAPIVNEATARGFDTLRNLMVASRLGSAAISALPDEATLQLTARVNRLPQAELIRNELAALNPANHLERRLANRAGIALDAMLGEINRFGSDQLGPSWSSKLSNTVIRASGLEALDSARRRAFGVTMFSALGQLTRDHAKLGSLDSMDHRILLSKGMTDADWQVWRMAELEDWGRGPGGDAMLTPDAVARVPDAALTRLAESEGTTESTLRQQAITKLLAHVLEEVDMAVIRPGAKEKVFAGAGLDRGTWKGELVRSFFLFKMFPLSMISNHWMRGVNMPTIGSRASYLASLVAGTTILGAVAMEIDQVLQGKDPRNLFDPSEKGFYRNWLAAFLKGGSLGIYGDLLFSNTTKQGQGALATIEGPILSLGEETLNLTQGNMVQALQGKNTHAAADLVHFAKGVTPGANLWYAKAALDHLIFQQLQEYASPGYLERMQSRMQREYGDKWWWKPSAGVGEINAPQVGRIAGH